MPITQTKVIISHDTAYGDDLIRHLNQALGCKDMIALPVQPEDAGGDVWESLAVKYRKKLKRPDPE